jgi:energy-coupling factor transport system ATP-binding protein
MMLERLPHNQPHEGTVLEVEDLRYVYPPPRPVVGVDRMSFTISSQEYVAIIGQNGSGKTTMARCISTYLRPTEGQVRILGKDPFQIPIRERPNFVGYCFQNPDLQLFKDSVLDDVRFSLENLRCDPDTIADATQTILEDLDLLEQAQEHPFRLSKGDRQRLAIAVVAVMQPAILFIDEPTTGLDAARSREVMELCQRLREQLGMTIMIISHNMELVAEYCSRVIVVGQGRILSDGTPVEVFGRADLLAETSMEPPPIGQLCARLGIGDPMPLGVEDAGQALLEACR